MYLLGYDLGSSSIKATVLDAATGRAVASATSPATEMAMESPHPGWAEQHPDRWWEHTVAATRQLAATLNLQEVKAVGIAYQMHGLVVVDRDRHVLRPAIIWCDSRAVEIGERAFQALGPERCLADFLNSPGNFTAAKLRWVQEHEPALFDRIDRLMLPGDYLAMRLTDEINTTVSGLSEGVLWNFRTGAPASELLDHWALPAHLLPALVPAFGPQGEVSRAAAEVLGLAPGTPVTYRAGDQPNNAFSLNVLHPGEVAATAGTSGVVYGIQDEAQYDAASRVNTFVHVNHRPEQPRYGVLLCVNGTGSQNSWLRNQLLDHTLGYDQMNELAATAPPGADGLVVLPFGNGAERMLGNRRLGGQLHHLDFNRHGRPHLLRAAQEGIAFSLRYGLDVMRSVGVSADTVRAGQANLFLSPLFRQTFADVTGATVELFDTDGAQGAARGAGVGLGTFATPRAALAGLQKMATVWPDPSRSEVIQAAYQRWHAALTAALANDKR